MPRSMPIFMRRWNRSLLRGARSWRPGPELAFDVLIPPLDVVRTVNRRRRRRRRARRGSARRRPAGRRSRRRPRGGGVRPWIVAWWVSVMSIRGAHPVELGQPLEAVLEDRLVDVSRRRVAWVSRTQVGGWMSVGEAGIRRGLDVDRPEAAVGRAPRPSTSIRSASQRDADAGPLEDLEERASCGRTGRPQGHLAAGHGAGDGERPGLDPVGDDVVLGAAQAALAAGPRSCPGRSARRRRPSSGGTR